MRFQIYVFQNDQSDSSIFLASWTIYIGFIEMKNRYIINWAIPDYSRLFRVLLYPLSGGCFSAFLAIFVLGTLKGRRINLLKKGRTISQYFIFIALKCCSVLYCIVFVKGDSK